MRWTGWRHQWSSAGSPGSGIEGSGSGKPIVAACYWQVWSSPVSDGLECGLAHARFRHGQASNCASEMYLQRGAQPGYEVQREPHRGYSHV